MIKNNNINRESMIEIIIQVDIFMKMAQDRKIRQKQTVFGYFVYL